jgi:O-antigen/teichoic acid export membrane protein
MVAHERDPPRFAETFRLGTVQLLGLSVVGSYFLLLNPEKTVRVILGPDWEGAVPLLRLLAFVPFFDQFALLGGEMLKARHRDRAWLGVMLLNLVSLVVAGVLLTRSAGAAGMAVANYLLVGNVVMAVLVRQELGAAGFRALLADLARVYLVPLPFFAAMLALPAASWPRFGASLLAGAAAVGALVWIYRRRFRAYFALGRRERAAAMAAAGDGAVGEASR